MSQNNLEQQTKRAAVYFARTGRNSVSEEHDPLLLMCREYAEKNGFFVVKVYCDDLPNGDKDRFSFRRMISDIHWKEFEAVIIPEQTIDIFGEEWQTWVINSFTEDGIEVRFC